MCVWAQFAVPLPEHSGRYAHMYRLNSTTNSMTNGSNVYRHRMSVHQKCGRHTLPANSSEMTVIHSASTNRMYEMPTWWELGSWYGWPPISSMWKPSGKMTAAQQNSTTVGRNM